MAETIVKLWEKRSRIYGTKIEGVLQKSFPRILNKYIHNWMLSQVQTVISPDMKVTVLDVGCGYGRLSKPLLQKFPRCKTVGVDIAQPYVDLYNKELFPRGRAVRGDVRALPFKSSSFDVVIIVTTLMYMLTSKDQDKAIGELFRVLKPGGTFVIIERNPLAQSIITLGGMLSKIHGKQEIAAVGFYPEFMTHLIKKHQLSIIKTAGIPVWTLFLPVLWVTAMLNSRLTQRLLLFVNWLDQRLNFLLTFSLYISYTGKRV